MTLRCPPLPLLPGYTFKTNFSQTRFPIRSQFDLLLNTVTAPTDTLKLTPKGEYICYSKPDRYPSVYTRGEVAEVPGWVAFDKHILAFDAFFQESMHEVAGSPFQIRKVKIFFHLEDGTVQVVEPKTENSGMPQGTLINRQRIPFPAPMDGNFYDIIDFNVGREVELYGKVFKIINCDNFTRVFLNRCGIAVPDPINLPPDPYQERLARSKIGMLPKKPNRRVDTFGQFLSNDRKVLRFSGYWDDRATEYGILHKLDIFYYLADDTIEMKEIIPPNSGRDSGFMFLKRAKLPKVYRSLPEPGLDSPFTVLNVLGPGLQGGRFIADPLDCGRTPVEYYKDNDLCIGSAINCYGRKIVIVDADPYTKEYYRKKYGVDDFTPLEVPKSKEDEDCIQKVERELPPWNGFGSHEDSAQNCITVEPKPPHRDFRKFLAFDKVGMDTHILKFSAKMISRVKENCTRNFVISYYLADDTMSVYEVAKRNSGFSSGMFYRKGQMVLPGQPVYSSVPPECYGPQHMFIGSKLVINEYIFVLTGADEYALRYMEINCKDYPKGNIHLIMDKVREKLRPIYKDFVADNLPEDLPVLPYEKLRLVLCRIMGDDWTEHEMVTIARHFSASERKERFTKEHIRAIVLTELKRQLWDDLDRLREYMILRDPERTGFLPRAEVANLLKGCRLPIDSVLMDSMLDVAEKNEKCDIDYEKLLCFLDRNICPPPDVEPLNIKHELWWGSEREPEAGVVIDWCAFNKFLDLEGLLVDAATPEHEKNLAALAANDPKNKVRHVKPVC